MMWIPAWDFSWQEQYTYKDFIRLPKGTVLRGFVRYDNTESNPDNPFNPPQTVSWGPMSNDEMGSVTLSVTPAVSSDIDTLNAAYRDHLEDGFLDRFFAEMSKGGDQPQTPPFLKNLVNTMDANRDGKLSSDEKKGIKAFLKSSGMWERLQGFR
jgi:hypothetical protein